MRESADNRFCHVVVWSTPSRFKWPAGLGFVTFSSPMICVHSALRVGPMLSSPCGLNLGQVPEIFGGRQGRELGVQQDKPFNRNNQRKKINVPL